MEKKVKEKGIFGRVSSQTRPGKGQAVQSRTENGIRFS